MVPPHRHQDVEPETAEMTNTMLNIKVVQPRMMSMRQAADYIGIPLKRFSRICSVRPVALAEGDERYDIRDLDQWLDHLKAGHADPDNEIVGRLG
jgi:hypothetical protein